MEENIKELLTKEIAAEIKDLSKFQSGSEEKTEAIDALATLYKLKIEEDKSQRDIADKVKERYFKTGIAVAEIILPLVFYGIWMGKGFKFEETGSITSTTFKGLINRFRPTK